MKINPERIRWLHDELNRARETYRDVVEEDRQIQRKADDLIDYVKAKYDRIVEPRPINTA